VDIKTEAIQAIKKSGGSSALGKQLGISRNSVNRWKQSGIPFDRCSEVSKLTGISALELRPDFL